MPRTVEGGAFEDTSPRPACGDGIIAPALGESCDPSSTEADAQVKGCTNCHIDCEEGVKDEAGHCYFFAGAEAQYKEASQRCSEQGGHVVTLTSEREVAFIASKFPAESQGYWVGLVYRGEESAYIPARAEEPGFPFIPTSGPCDGCFGVGADGGMLPLADPDAGNDSDCVVAGPLGWSRVPCLGGVARNTICEREPVGTRSLDCIIGGFCFDVPATIQKKTYVVYLAASDPDQAAQTCAGVDGGSLVVLDTREEREQVAHEVIARYSDSDLLRGQELWIGLSEDAGTWAWQDGVIAIADAGRPLPWGNAQPGAVSGARAVMRLTKGDYDTQLAYADDGGRTPRLFICQRTAQ